MDKTRHTGALIARYPALRPATHPVSIGLVGMRLGWPVGDIFGVVG